MGALGLFMDGCILVIVSPVDPVVEACELLLTFVLDLLNDCTVLLDMIETNGVGFLNERMKKLNRRRKERDKRLYLYR